MKSKFNKTNVFLNICHKSSKFELGFFPQRRNLQWIQIIPLTRKITVAESDKVDWAVKEFCYKMNGTTKVRFAPSRTTQSAHQAREIFHRQEEKTHWGKRRQRLKDKEVRNKTYVSV